MRITTGMTQRSTLSDLNRINERVTKAQIQASSNRQISRPSDDPYDAARALQLRESLAGVKQYQRNIQDGQGWQETAEEAMSSITDSAQRARDLLVQGTSDTTDPASRESIAKELDQIIAGIKQNANATYEGRYVFSGAATDVAPYLDGATDTFQGDTTRLVARQVGPGVSLNIGITAESFLGSGSAPGDGKLLDTLRSVAANLRSGDTAGLKTDLGRLGTNLHEALSARALNGARQNRLDARRGGLGPGGEAATRPPPGT